MENMCRINKLYPGRLREVLEIERESFSDPWTENMFHELLAGPSAHSFIAENNGEMLGYIMFYYIKPEIQIINIAVKKSARNKNIGALLLKSALAFDKFEKATLEVRESNIAAINLYKKFGFKIDGIRKNYYRLPKEHAVLMSLEGNLNLC